MVIRVLRIQALSVDTDIILKILQSLPLMLILSNSSQNDLDDGGDCIPEEALRQAFVICTDLRSRENPAIFNTASATLRADPGWTHFLTPARQVRRRIAATYALKWTGLARHRERWVTAGTQSLTA